MSIGRKLRRLLMKRVPLTEIPLPVLLGPIADVDTMYGSPAARAPVEDFPEATVHSYDVSSAHSVDAIAWREVVHSIMFFSAKPDPATDVEYVLRSYAMGHGWQCIEEGYWYGRDDGQVVLWCSALPTIGIATAAYRKAKQDYKRRETTARVLAKVASPAEWLKGDVHWAPNEEVMELQRMAIDGNPAPLQAFAQCSPLIAFTSNAQTICVVRKHEGHYGGAGLVEYNRPPEDGKGLAVDVINVFYQTPTGSLWSKIAMPGNARIEFIRCTGEVFEVCITRQSDGSRFTVRGTTRDLGVLAPSDQKQDEYRWARIEECAARE